MTRRAPGLLARDLSASFAFGSVAISGAVPLPVLIVFPIALGLSVLGVRPLAGRRAASVVVLLLIAVALAVAVFLGAIDLVIAAVSFATLVTAHRMLAEPTPEASRQVLLSSVLLVSGGAALTAEILFAVFLIGCFVSASWALAWLVVGGQTRLEDEERRAVSRQLTLGAVITLGLGLAFFVLFPRLSWNLASRRATPGLGNVTGMSDTVRLGGGGDIKTNARVVLRATLTPDPGRVQLGAYWVGRHFDLFDGLEWRSTATSRASAQFVNTLRLRRGRRITQEIETTGGYGSRTLVALDLPVLFGQARALSTAGSQSMLLVQAQGDQVFAGREATAMSYSAESVAEGDLDPTPPTDAASALPPLAGGITALADELAGTRTAPEEVAEALEQGLKRRYAYTLELPGTVADPLADFLLVRRQGHCEDFATALAVLLRVKGIPSRVVTGFFGGERAGARYVLRGGDAHAWVEGWVDGRWRRFDATPDDGRPASSNAWKAALTQAWEQLEEWWRSRVVDYTFRSQIDLARSLVRPPRNAELDTPEPAASPAPTLKRWWGPLLAGVVALALVAAFRRRSTERPHPAASFLADLEAGLRRAGIREIDAEPIEEVAAHLTARQHPLAPAVTRACRRYLEARFGGKPLPLDERRALLAPFG